MSKDTPIQLTGPYHLKFYFSDHQTQANARSTHTYQGKMRELKNTVLDRAAQMKQDQIDDGGIQGQRDVETVKRVHRLTHVSSDDMKQIFSDESATSAKMEEACDKVLEAWDICASSGSSRQ